MCRRPLCACCWGAGPRRPERQRKGGGFVDGYEKQWTDGRLRLQFTLEAEPEERKVLTLQQMQTVIRRTLRPERFTQTLREETAIDPTRFFTSGGGESSYRTLRGTWFREGRQIAYYLDDAVEQTPEGSLSVGFLRWELPGEDAQAERWFAAAVQALLDAQDALRLYGHI